MDSDTKLYGIVNLTAIRQEMMEDERISRENGDQLECRYWANALRWVLTSCLVEEL